MSTCRNCGIDYRGEPPDCEPCAEFKREEWREHFLEPRLKLKHCTTCGQTFSPIGYHWHRTRTDFAEERERAKRSDVPKGRARKRNR